MTYSVEQMNGQADVKTIVKAQTQLGALRKFRRKLVSFGVYEYVKLSDGWALATSYGAFFRAHRIR